MRPRDFIFALLILSLLAACAGPISKETLHKVNMEITISELKSAPQSHKGKVVLIGGVIVKLTNESGKSILEILEFPLGSSRRPREKKSSRGRFLAEYSGFLDPEVYQEAMAVTIAGTFTGLRSGEIGEAAYKYPVIKIKEHKLFKRGGFRPNLSIGLGLGGSF